MDFALEDSRHLNDAAVEAVKDTQTAATRDFQVGPVDEGTLSVAVAFLGKPHVCLEIRTPFRKERRSCLD